MLINIGRVIFVLTFTQTVIYLYNLVIGCKSNCRLLDFLFIGAFYSSLAVHWKKDPGVNDLWCCQALKILGKSRGCILTVLFPASQYLECILWSPHTPIILSISDEQHPNYWVFLYSKFIKLIVHFVQLQVIWISIQIQ